MGRKILLALALVIGLTGFAQAAIQLPFTSEKTWYICQGYNGPASHAGKPMLDLSTYPGSPVNGGCDPNHGTGDSQGQVVVAPFSGKLSTLGRIDMVCITASDGNNSMKIGHFNLGSNLKMGDTVQVNQALGTVMEPNDYNASISHIHVSGHKGASCTGELVAFDDAHAMRFEDATDLGYDGSTNQHAGLALTKYGKATNTTWHPDGSLIRAEGENTVWFLEQGKRRGFVSESVFFGYGFTQSDVIIVPQGEVNCLPLGQNITGSGQIVTTYAGFKEGTLWRVTGSAPVYIRSNGKFSWLNVTAGEFTSLGYSWGKITEIPSVIPYAGGPTFTRSDFNTCAPTSLPNGSVCATGHDCLSTYCDPGPEAQRYCLDARKNCPLPGHDGIMFGQGYDYQGKSYGCLQGQGIVARGTLPPLRYSGEVCSLPSDCLSGYCDPGPEGQRYCLDARKNCPKPGSAGIMFGEGYDDNGTRYECIQGKGLILAGTSLPNGRECTSNTSCASGFCSPGGDGKNYCLDARKHCARPLTEGMVIGETAYFNNVPYRCTGGDLMIPLVIPQGGLPYGMVAEFDAQCASTYASPAPWGLSYCIHAQSHCARPGTEGSRIGDPPFFFNGAYYECVASNTLIRR